MLQLWPVGSRLAIAQVEVFFLQHRFLKPISSRGGGRGAASGGMGEGGPFSLQLWGAWPYV